MKIEKQTTFIITLTAEEMRELVAACDYARRSLEETIGPLTETGSAGRAQRQVSTWRALHSVLQNSRAA